jgi:hypothetical protein
MMPHWLQIGVSVFVYGIGVVFIPILIWQGRLMVKELAEAIKEELKR